MHFRGNGLACDDRRRTDAIYIYIYIPTNGESSRSPVIGTNASRHALKVFAGHYDIAVHVTVNSRGVDGNIFQRMSVNKYNFVRTEKHLYIRPL